MNFLSKTISRADARLGLFQRMAQTADADLETAAARNDGAVGHAMQRCLSCPHENACRRFLDGLAAECGQRRSTPAFCPNHRFFEQDRVTAGD